MKNMKTVTSMPVYFIAQVPFYKKLSGRVWGKSFLYIRAFKGLKFLSQSAVNTDIDLEFPSLIQQHHTKANRPRLLKIIEREKSHCVSFGTLGEGLRQLCILCAL